MQQSGNDEIKTMFVVIAMMGGLIYAVAVVAALVVGLIAGFLTLCLTILCFIAWDREITLFGYTLAPAEAHAFVGRGLAGAGLCCAFVVFCALVMGVHVSDRALQYTALVGYIAGSLGSEFVIAHRAEHAAPEPEILPPQIEPSSTPSTHRLPSPEAKPFRFASWNDEDAQR